MATALNDEQRRKIEENRLKALALRASRQQSTTVSSSVANPKPQTTPRPPNTPNASASRNFESNIRSSPPASKFSATLTSSFQRNSPGKPASTLSPLTKSFPRLLSEQQSSYVGNSSGVGMTVGISGGPITIKCYLISRQRFAADVRYFPPLIALFKALATKQYDATLKLWSFELREYYQLERQVKHQFGNRVKFEPFPAFILRVFDQKLRGNVIERTILQADLSKVDDRLVSTLLTFQREGVNFAVSRKGRVLIADDMGLGKTLQALCIAAYYRSEWPLLIVAPSSVRFAWRQHILQWLPSVDPQDINMLASSKDNCMAGVINILSYDLMARCHKQLAEQDFQVIIMDESHFLKNSKSVRTQRALPLLKKASRVLLLSGTPALSRPAELHTQLVALDPITFRSFHEYGLRYCDAKQANWGWDYSGSSNLAELQHVMEEHLMIRRLKKDVLGQLPSKYRTMVVLDPSCVRIDKTMTASHKLVDKSRGVQRKSALLEYFHVTGATKIKAVTDYVLDLLEAERKFLLFAHHQEMLDAVENVIRSKKYGMIRIDGRTSCEQRGVFCDRFQRDETVRVAVLSITAANSGINLTAASLVVFAELFWNPGVLVQAEDRAHRIGQMDLVNVQYLVARNTADDYIWPLIQHKLDVLSKAGLTKDDFCDTTTCLQKDKRQKEVTNFFEESSLDDEIPFTEEEFLAACGSPASSTADSGIVPYVRRNGKSDAASTISTSSAMSTATASSVAADTDMELDWSDDDLPEDFDPDAPWPKKPKIQ